MPSDYKSLDRDALRADLAQRAFSDQFPGTELFGMEIEAFARRWPGEGGVPGVVRMGASGGCPSGSIQCVEDYAASLEIAVVPPGEPHPRTDPRRQGVFTFEPGGQIEFSCAPRWSPAHAYELCARILDGLELHLEPHGVRLISLGADPWHLPDEIGLQTSAARYVCMDSHYASIGEFGRHMMRRTAAAHVNLDLRGPRGALRWRAAQLLAPVALATFACSPMAGGAHTGDRSSRGRAWLHLDPSRTGFPGAFPADPEGDPVEQYLDFALDARVMLLRREERWLPMTMPLTFRQWMEMGLGGTWPGLDDWRYHLTTLFPEVRPKGYLELRSAAGQARPFRAVPLAWPTARLTVDSCLQAVLERLLPSAGELEERMVRAVRSGLADPELREDARFAFGLASDGLLRCPEGFFSREILSAFTVFGQRFTLAGRSPADELLDEFLRRGGLDGAAWKALEDDWSAAVGLPTPAERGASAGV